MLVCTWKKIWAYHCLLSDSLPGSKGKNFPMPFCKTKYFEEGDKLLSSHIPSVSSIHVVTATCLLLEFFSYSSTDGSASSGRGNAGV